MPIIEFNLKADETLNFCGSQLTLRQSQVLAKIVEGKRNAQIAEEIGVGESVVYDHMHRLIGRTGLSGRYELAAKSAREHLDYISVHGADHDALSFDALYRELNCKQQDVLDYLIEGKSYKTIGSELGETEKTVTNCVNSINNVFGMDRLHTIVLMNWLNARDFKNYQSDQGKRSVFENDLS